MTSVDSVSNLTNAMVKELLKSDYACHSCCENNIKIVACFYKEHCLHFFIFYICHSAVLNDLANLLPQSKDWRAAAAWRWERNAGIEEREENKEQEIHCGGQNIIINSSGSRRAGWDHETTFAALVSEGGRCQTCACETGRYVRCQTARWVVGCQDRNRSGQPTETWNQATSGTNCSVYFIRFCSAVAKSVAECIWVRAYRIMPT